MMDFTPLFESWRESLAADLAAAETEQANIEAQAEAARAAEAERAAGLETLRARLRVLGRDPIPAALAALIEEAERDSSTPSALPAAALAQKVESLTWRIEDLRQALVMVDRLTAPPALTVIPPEPVPAAADLAEFSDIEFKGVA